MLCSKIMSHAAIKREIITRSCRHCSTAGAISGPLLRHQDPRSNTSKLQSLSVVPQHAGLEQSDLRPVMELWLPCWQGSQELTAMGGHLAPAWIAKALTPAVILTRPRNRCFFPIYFFIFQRGIAIQNPLRKTGVFNKINSQS